MKESFQTAFTEHPNVKKYFVGFPKNFPDGSQGKSEHKKWLEKIEEWKNWAKKQSNCDIEFVSWNESQRSS